MLTVTNITKPLYRERERERERERLMESYEHYLPVEIWQMILSRANSDKIRTLINLQKVCWNWKKNIVPFVKYQISITKTDQFEDYIDMRYALISTGLRASGMIPENLTRINIIYPSNIAEGKRKHDSVLDSGELFARALSCKLNAHPSKLRMDYNSMMSEDITFLKEDAKHSFSRIHTNVECIANTQTPITRITISYPTMLLSKSITLNYSGRVVYEIVIPNNEVINIDSLEVISANTVELVEYPTDCIYVSGQRTYAPSGSIESREVHFCGLHANVYNPMIHNPLFTQWRLDKNIELLVLSEYDIDITELNDYIGKLPKLTHIALISCRIYNHTRNQYVRAQDFVNFRSIQNLAIVNCDTGKDNIFCNVEMARDNKGRPIRNSISTKAISMRIINAIVSKTTNSVYIPWEVYKSIDVRIIKCKKLYILVEEISLINLDTDFSRNLPNVETFIVGTPNKDIDTSISVAKEQQIPNSGWLLTRPERFIFRDSCGLSNWKYVRDLQLRME